MRQSFIAAVALLAAACAGQDASVDSLAATATPEPSQAMASPAGAASPAASAPASSGAAPVRRPAARAGAAAPAAAEAPARSAVAPAARVPEYRELTLPAGTVLPLRLASALASDSSQVEDAVQATLREDLVVDGRVAIPAGSELSGRVVDVERSGRVKGRARLAVRFTMLRQDGDEYDIRTEAIQRVADATKGEDATKIGIGAGAGAALGAIVGGGSGAAKGAAIGAAAGTGAVLATRGEEVRLESGSSLDTKLTAPLAVRVQLD